MKILCIIDSLGSGGAQRQLVEIAKGLKEKGHEVGFITYHEINFFKPELDKNEIWVETIVEPNYLKRLLKIRKAIRRQKPDAVLSFLEAANFISTLSGFPYRKWKLVVGERSANPKILKSIKLRFYRLFHLFADYIVANSYANLELVDKINPFIIEKKKRVIYNIVSVPSVDIISTNKGSTKIVVAASYRPVKNLDGLIEAVNVLPDEYKSKLKIEWYGNIEDKEYYLQYSQKIKDYGLDCIIYLNLAEKNIFEKYTNADFVGLFSHYEGFPNTICEAMAMNKPVIVSAISDIPIFIEDGINGFICEANNVDSIKEALIKAIDSKENEIRKMGLTNKRIASENFDKINIIDDYLGLLQNE